MREKSGGLSALTKPKRRHRPTGISRGRRVSAEQLRKDAITAALVSLGVPLARVAEMAEGLSRHGAQVSLDATLPTDAEWARIKAMIAQVQVAVEERLGRKVIGATAHVSVVEATFEALPNILLNPDGRAAATFQNSVRHTRRRLAKVSARRQKRSVAMAAEHDAFVGLSARIVREVIANPNERIALGCHYALAELGWPHELASVLLQWRAQMRSLHAGLSAPFTASG